LACISARKVIWKATTTTLPNTLWEKDDTFNENDGTQQLNAGTTRILYTTQVGGSKVHRLFIHNLAGWRCLVGWICVTNTDIWGLFCLQSSLLVQPLSKTRTLASWLVYLCTVLLESFHVLNVGHRMALDTDSHLLCPWNWSFLLRFELAKCSRSFTSWRIRPKVDRFS
jgi:hypothetical protein